MNKPVYLFLSTLAIIKIVMNEFWYGHVKPKYRDVTCYVTWIQIALWSI